uniref:Uncharacterized protein n=1 Tax=Populus trichocarpa TaxID=3694 RepID=U5GQP2_POPTR
MWTIFSNLSMVMNPLLITQIALYGSCYAQGCRFCSSWHFIFLIGTINFGFGAFQRFVLESCIYIFNNHDSNSSLKIN